MSYSAKNINAVENWHYNLRLCRIFLIAELNIPLVITLLKFCSCISHLILERTTEFSVHYSVMCNPQSPYASFACVPPQFGLEKETHSMSYFSNPHFDKGSDTDRRWKKKMKLSTDLNYHFTVRSSLSLSVCSATPRHGFSLVLKLSEAYPKPQPCPLPQGDQERPSKGIAGASLHVGVIKRFRSLSNQNH